jgi:NADH-quinone oxidoreductase subunit H
MITDIVGIALYPGIVFMLFFSLIYSGILRKLAAHMQSRIGPPIWQPILDIIKLFGKEGIVPEQAKPGFTLWPVVALVSVVVAGLFIPVAGLVSLQLPGGFIILIYFLVFGSLSIYLSGLSSSNPFAVVGSIRGIIQMFAYEFPFIVSLIVPMIFLNTLSPLVVNAYQLQGTWLGAVFPFAAAAFLVSVLAKIELPPFHIPDAHQEIVAGYSTEFTGKRLAMLELARMVKMFVLLALGVAIFFGGSGPGPGGFAIFIVKTLVLLFVLTILRVLLARLRIDQSLRFCWILGFIALIDLVRVMII